MKFFEKRDRRGVACNPKQATGLLTGGAGTLFDTEINQKIEQKKYFRNYLPLRCGGRRGS